MDVLFARLVRCKPTVIHTKQEACMLFVRLVPLTLGLSA